MPPLAGVQPLCADWKVTTAAGGGTSSLGLEWALFLMKAFHPVHPVLQLHLLLPYRRAAGRSTSCNGAGAHLVMQRMQQRAWHGGKGLPSCDGICLEKPHALHI